MGAKIQSATVTLKPLKLLFSLLLLGFLLNICCLEFQNFELLNFSSALCYCRAKLLSSGGWLSPIHPSSVIRVYTPFSLNWSRLIPYLVRSTFSPYLSRSFLLFFKILHFYLFIYFYEYFSFSFTWLHMGEKLQTTSPLKVHSRFTPKNSCILLGMVSIKVV